MGLAVSSWRYACGGSVAAKISLGQVVAICIERWDELDDGVKTEIVDLLKRR